jgi:PhnB protein
MSPDARKTTVAAMLSVRRGAEAIEFYKQAFGAEVLFRLDAPDGAVVAQLAIEGADLWVADEAPAYQNFSPESLAGSTVRMVLTVDDPDAIFARAVSAGATVLQPVADQHYGWRQGRIADSYGHHWEIGKPLR